MTKSLKTGLWIAGGAAAVGLGYWGYKRWKQYRVFGPVTATVAEQSKAAVETVTLQSKCKFGNLSMGDTLVSRNGVQFEIANSDGADDPTITFIQWDTKATADLKCSEMPKYFSVPGESQQDRAYNTSEDVSESEMFGRAPFGIRVI